jgi:hypothetical protein
VTVQAVIAEFSRLSGGLAEARLKSQTMWQDASAYIRWCNAHEVADPNLFMWLRFRILRSARGAGARPSLRTLATESLLPRYRTIAHERVMAKHFDTQFERELISVNVGNEAVRRDYVVMGRSDLCEAQPNLSAGYHPYSVWCPQCPRTASCGAALNAREGFDVVALRLGKIDRAPDDVRRARAAR